jgi:hypothetical protein
MMASPRSIINSTNFTLQTELVVQLPRGRNEHLPLRQEFERYNAPQPSRMGEAAGNTASFAIHKPIEADTNSLQLIPTTPRPFSGNLFDYRPDEPDPHSLVAFSRDYKVVYFPIACASFQRHCLTFDFDRVLGHVFGPENVNPIFNGSKLGLARTSGGVRFTLMFVL